MKLNREECLYGTGISLAFFWILGWWVVLIAPITAFLWALGGASGYTAAWRRIGVSLVLGIVLSISSKNLWCLLSILPAFGFLCLGYGIPSTQPPDDGSVLGRFFWKLTGGKEWLTNLLTRGLIMSGLFLSFAIPLWTS